MFSSLSASRASCSTLRQCARRSTSARAHFSHSRPVALFGLFGGSKDKGQPQQQEEMGGSQGKAAWKPRAPDTPQKVSKAGFDVTPLSEEEKMQAAAGLPNMAKYVALEHGTERAFTGKTVNGYSHDNKARGMYVSAVGGLPLFPSDTKFDSGTGWPSFFAPVDPEHIIEVVDLSIPFMPRVEVLDRRSGAHLGHVFDDGPRPTGKRYCINAAALKFIPEGTPLPDESKPADWK